MKIVNIHYSGFGGQAAVVNGLVCAQGAELHEWIMGYYGVATLDPSHVAFCSERDLHYAVFRPKPRNPWSAWRQMASWLVYIQPDVIICHSSTAIPPCAWFACRKQVPLIAVEHTSNEVKSPTEWLGSISAMMLADRVVLLTEGYSRLLKTSLGPIYDHRKVRQIANGVSTKQFRPLPAPKSRPHSIRAGMAGRMSLGKHQDLLMDVSSSLGIDLELAGDGETMGSLKAHAAVNRYSQVKFCGLVPHADMPEWFRGLDLYLHASNGETFSLAILQAMSSGLPIIASDISGMNEILGQDGDCGFLVPNSFDAWRHAVLRLANNPGLRAQMGRAARLRAENCFSSSVMLRGYLSLLDEFKK